MCESEDRGRKLRYRAHVIDANLLDSVTGHVGKCSFGRLLDDCDAAVRLDRGEARGTIVEHARKHDARDFGSELLRSERNNTSIEGR